MYGSKRCNTVGENGRDCCCYKTGNIDLFFRYDMPPYLMFWRDVWKRGKTKRALTAYCIDALFKQSIIGSPLQRRWLAVSSWSLGRAALTR